MTKNRILELFQRKTQGVVNIYYTAGFPNLTDTRIILKALDQAGADIVEIGMPYSDPVADGETIQQANQRALENGMTIATLFEQLSGMRQEIGVPIVLMGYINPVLQFGIENFCKKCQEVGIDGLILPDLPMDEYLEEYQSIFEAHGLLNIFLITPNTSDERIRRIDENSSGFIYMVSSASITGTTSGIAPESEAYFARINAMKLTNPRLIGFGIKDKETFKQASAHAQGAIIGSQFIRVLESAPDITEATQTFVASIRS